MNRFEKACEISRKLNEMIRKNQDILSAYNTYKSIFMYQNSDVVESEKTRRFDRKLAEISDCIDVVDKAMNVLQPVVNDIDTLNEPL